MNEVPMTVEDEFSSQRPRYTAAPMKERGRRFKWKKKIQLFRLIDNELTSFHIGRGTCQEDQMFDEWARD